MCARKDDRRNTSVSGARCHTTQSGGLVSKKGRCISERISGRHPGALLRQCRGPRRSVQRTGPCEALGKLWFGEVARWKGEKERFVGVGRE
eukprot:7321079-Pyramimonas_sp.AAC.1